jgi:NAD(P)-dependent dehydrogenase (short-subunit alcohol dehydrogenase family)
MKNFYDTEFNGKVVVVTGGTAGIGRHLVLTLIRQGAEVFFCGRDSTQGKLVESQCEGRGHYCSCDVTRPENITEFIDETLKFNGRIDYLVNNVAMDSRMKFEDATIEQFDQFIATNLRSALLISQAALPGLRRGDGKAIVNLGTTNYMLGLAPFTLYSSAKAGLLGFTRALARELGPENIRVNMLSPGWIMTEKQLKDYVSEQDKIDLLRDQALPFLLTEEQITPPLLFLLSSAANGITGQNLVVDGGKLMQ